jgi:uncharacterized repeat protein (TIGR03847 family)
MTDRIMRGPDRFTAGTVGDVGQRVFLIQASRGTERLTIKVEKQQLAVLATYLTRAIEPLGRPGHLPDDMALALSPDDGIDLIAGEISVAIDEGTGTVEVVVEDLDEDGPGTVAIEVSREQAAAFAIHSTRLVESGRPPCPLCGLPLDPRGHDCPRTNGHRAPIT